MSRRGLPAGEIARLLDVPHNTMSTHLTILSRTGLVSSERDGRSIVYRVDLDAVRGFFVYLLKDCCDGRPELCQPLLDDLTPVANQPELPVPDKVYNVLFLCTGNSPVQFSPKQFCSAKGWANSTPTAQEASPRARSIPTPSTCCNSSITQRRASAQRAGMNSRLPVRRNSISYSRFATMRQRKFARSGRASR